MAETKEASQPLHCSIGCIILLLLKKARDSIPWIQNLLRYNGSEHTALSVMENCSGRPLRSHIQNAGGSG